MLISPEKSTLEIMMMRLNVKPSFQFYSFLPLDLSNVTIKTKEIFLVPMMQKSRLLKNVHQNL